MELIFGFHRLLRAPLFNYHTQGLRYLLNTGASQAGGDTQIPTSAIDLNHCFISQSTGALEKEEIVELIFLHLLSQQRLIINKWT